MITVPTQKLYFNRFLYCCKFEVDEEKGQGYLRKNPAIRRIKSILSESGCPHRTRIDWRFLPSKRKDKTIRVTLSCYFSSDDLYATLLASEHAENLIWISRPASDEHKEVLQSGSEIMIREKLLYNRFRYKVNLRAMRYPRVDNSAEIMSWIADAFHGKEEGRKGDYMIVGKWLLSLYIKDHSDFVLTKLSMSDHIASMVRVDTFAEHGITAGDIGPQPEVD